MKINPKIVLVLFLFLIITVSTVFADNCQTFCNLRYGVEGGCRGFGVCGTGQFKAPTKGLCDFLKGCCCNYVPGNEPCRETDMYKETTKKGQCIDSSSFNEDYCTGNQLTEYYCSKGECKNLVTDCSKGCVLGACLKPASTTSTSTRQTTTTKQSTTTIRQSGSTTTRRTTTTIRGSTTTSYRSSTTGISTTSTYRPSTTTSRITSTTIPSGDLSGTLMYFYYDGCSWCAKEKPVIDQIISEYPSLQLVKIDKYANPGKASDCVISGYPTIIFKQPGCARKNVGYLKYDSLLFWLRNSKCDSSIASKCLS